MPLHRCLIAGLVGSILALGAIISLSACSPVTPTTPAPAVTAISPTSPRPTATLTPTPAQPTTIYFLVDRSNSMKQRCPSNITETYQLPGFFTQVGAAINEINDSPFISVSEIWFPKPDNNAYPPIPASEEVGKEWRHEVPIENQTTNEYGEALNQVWKYLNPQSNNVIVVLTDGTFSGNVPDQQKHQEAQTIREELSKLSKAGVKVYLLLCGNPQEEESPWLGQEGLVGSYNLEDLGQITSLGNALFGEEISRHQYNVKLGWLTGTTSVTLPGETITFTAKIATVGGGVGNPWIDYSEARPPISCDSGLCKLERGFERFSRPAHSCEPQEIEIHLDRSPFGFYLLKGYTVPPWEYQVEPSVNLEAATLTISLKTSPYFPHDFEECFSAEMESKIIAEGLISAQFRDTQATLVWRPQSVEPGDYEGSLRIKSVGGQVVASWPITLPVRFKPLPLKESIIAIPSGDKYLSLEYKYQFVPPGVSPMVFLCSKYTPDEIINKINPYIDCGKAPCKSGQGQCSIVCPTPIPCPQEVSGFCEYCVPINAGQMDASSLGCIQSGDNSGSPNKFQQEYKMTLFQCLARAEKGEEKKDGQCGYSSLLIYWTDQSKVILAPPDIYRRNQNAWERTMNESEGGTR